MSSLPPKPRHRPSPLNPSAASAAATPPAPKPPVIVKGQVRFTFRSTKLHRNMDAVDLPFTTWALTENTITSSPLEQFRGKIIGVDAEDYLHLLLNTGSREPLLPALGGKPFCLWRRLDDDLEAYKAAGIEPTFIFNGLDLACRDRKSVLDEAGKRVAVLNEAWATYDLGKGEEAVQNFGKACTYRTYQMLRSLQMRLHSKGVQVQTAPYSAAAQLVYLEREGVIDGVKGSASCLLFGADRVILDFEWEKQSAVWVTIQKCLAKLDVNRDSFINMCLISGVSILQALPELETEPPASRVAAARAILKASQYDIDGLLRSKEMAYRELYYQALLALRHPPIMTSDGDVQLVDWKKGPSDAHEFIGRRLPSELYFYLSKGLTGPRLLNWRTRMDIVETPPLDGGASTAYKELVQSKLLPLRAQALALMTKSLNRYYHKQEIKMVGWWQDRQVPVAVDVNDVGDAADKWHVRTAQLPQLSGDSATPLAYALKSLEDNEQAKKTVTPRVKGEPLREVKEIRANIVWRFLQERGYVNPEHTLSPWGKALKAALDRGVSTNDTPATSTEMEEAIFMAFEMLRLKLLDKTPMFPVPPYTGGPIRGTDADKEQILLIARVACLGYLRHKSIGYTGPLSRNLLAYHQCAAAVRGALRDLLEMHACHMCLSNSVDRRLANGTYTDIAASLPFVEEPDLGLSLLVKCYLDELCQPADKRVLIAGWFPHVEDIGGDLRKAWKLWDAINAGVQAANGIVSSDMKRTFTSASEWLKTKLSEAATTNGRTNGTTNGTVNGTA